MHLKNIYLKTRNRNIQNQFYLKTLNYTCLTKICPNIKIEKKVTKVIEIIGSSHGSFPLLTENGIEKILNFEIRSKQVFLYDNFSKKLTLCRL